MNRDIKNLLNSFDMFEKKNNFEIYEKENLIKYHYFECKNFKYHFKYKMNIIKVA